MSENVDEDLECRQERFKKDRNPELRIWFERDNSVRNVNINNCIIQRKTFNDIQGCTRREKLKINQM